MMLADRPVTGPSAKPLVGDPLVDAGGVWVGACWLAVEALWGKEVHSARGDSRREP